jgi:hypothetical protein
VFLLLRLPTHSSVNVISVFSDAFTSAAPNANYFPGWGQATAASIVDLEGTNKTLKYSNLNYQEWNYKPVSMPVQ